MTLLEGVRGKCYSVQDIELEEQLKRRLQMLGLTQGTQIEVLNCKKGGSVIFKVRGTRFAIGKTTAKGILIGGEKDGKDN
ncbi:ferrous iron transport protein A [Sporanaerobium hydrogeniformans]|uniref:Ferrous iron transport protein A n=1 Tax=Sporanaerobium hydrogeniformans TaxID=3072179 RepID=A0AC61D9A7_9FIRM|nr:FeoA domain-containing protein [Sporanaerobium hydrogeniformans]PHV69298.1 ferrous iron transport protein A [Sporanaerobium hydrogeniformans]